MIGDATTATTSSSRGSTLCRSQSLREQLQQTIGDWEHGSARDTRTYDKRAWLGGLQRLQKQHHASTARHRRTGCNQFCQEPVTYWKKLEPFRPDWPHARQWYHPK